MVNSSGGVRKLLNRIYKRRMDAWELDLVTRTTNRVVRPFEWGMEWTANWPCAARVAPNGHHPAEYLHQLNRAAVANSDEFFGYEPPTDFVLNGNRLRFASPVLSPYPENNTVHAQWFPAKGESKSAVIVLPHWNSKEEQHVSLCQGLQFLGLSALRMSMPYHDARMPPELERADYAVSSNVARTVDAARQGVIDTRACIDWLQLQGYEKFGIVGTSLGSCYAFIASAHDERISANVFNLFSLYFADAVWTGQTTRHIRQGIEGKIELDVLRDAWMAVTPLNYVDHYARYAKKSLFIYASYDTTFLPEYAEEMIERIRLRELDHKVVVLPCGHHTAGKTPFKYMDGYQICAFLKRSL